MVKKNRTLFFILLISLHFIAFNSCKQTNNPYQIEKDIVVSKAGISTAHPSATSIGVDILKKGGNSIDAAIAVQFALAVCYPVAGNIGGGGFMVYRDENGEAITLDFREKAPLLATEKMYQDEKGEIIKGLSTEGILAVGVPGSVAGMEAAFEKYSKLKNWEILVQPAVELAENGFKLTANQAKNLNSSKEKFIRNNPNLESPFTQSTPHKEGDLFIQKELANTLRQILKNKAKGFYSGEIGSTLVAQMKASGGLITQNDLDSYESKWRNPISFEYKDYTIHSMPPPSSGGIILAQLFNAVDDHQFQGFHSTEDMHIIIEAEKRAYSDRAHFMGDADFFPIPVDELTSKEYMDIRMSNFSSEMASLSDSIEHGTIESEETTHFSIVDEYGTAVSLTTTLNGAYGSKVIADGGYLLNNEMDDFSSRVGFPNMYGLVGAEVNKIEPEKRMLSSMTPTIIEYKGELFMVIGTPGGSTIITSVFQACINVMEYEMPMAEAIHSCRFHHQWKPKEVFYEQDCLNNKVIEGLKEKGHDLKTRSAIGRMEGILVTKKGYEIAADNRGDDHAAGY